MSLIRTIEMLDKETLSTLAVEAIADLHSATLGRVLSPPALVCYSGN